MRVERLTGGLDGIVAHGDGLPCRYDCGQVFKTARAAGGVKWKNDRERDRAAMEALHAAVALRDGHELGAHGSVWRPAPAAVVRRTVAIAG